VSLLLLCGAGDPLAVVATSPHLLWNGIAVIGVRRFVEMPRVDDAPNPSLAELHADGSLTPYPGGGWNGWKPGADATKAFVSTNAVHKGPDGRLWVVDNGAVGFLGRMPVAGAQKIVVIDPATNAVTRVYRLAGALAAKSAIDDIRFHGGNAYITDAGAPGLIVMDVASGTVRRVLDHDPSMTAMRPALVDGKILRGPDGKPASINADQLEVTPDGKYLYVQPLPGPMYRIPIALLDDPKLAPAALSRQVEFWYNTPSLGGTAIDADGDLYLNDLSSDAVLKLTPDRHLSLVLHDARLHWADAPAFDGHGNLLIPVPQFDRSPPFNHGRDLVQYPVALYALHVGVNAAPHH
jgi:hypothetical protein